MEVLFLMLSGCGWLTVPSGKEPATVVVQRGDTLFVLARDRGCTVEQLREWNGIAGDLIEVGQTLDVFTELCTGGPSPSKARSRGARSSPPAAPGLRLPPEKPCIELADDLGEADMAASAGLTHEQAAAALSAFVPNVLPCISDAAPSRSLELELTVACTGRVARVAIADRADWPDPVAACVADVLRYTPFPAHGLPDGDLIRYPLRYTAPE